MYLIAFTAIAGLVMVFFVYFFFSKKEAALDEAAQEGKVDATFIKAGADVNAKDNDGWMLDGT